MGIMPPAMSLSLMRSLGLLLGGAVCCIPCCFFQLYILLGSRQNILHVGDVVLHQVFVEGMIDLQSGDEGSCGDIIIVVIKQGHLALKITDIVLESFLLTSS